MSVQLKTLKTLLVEAVLTYMCDRNLKTYINVNWAVLDDLNGSIDNVERDGPVIIMNLSPQATNSFNAANNKLIFNCRFGGVDTLCVVPTAAIHSVYDPNTGDGMVFEPSHDALVERDELNNKGLTKVPQQIVEGVPKRVSHLTVVK
jgi:stringent starvation protein B